MAYYDLIIRTPEGNGYTTPEGMKRVDEHINQYGGMFLAPPPTGKIVQNDDGTWNVRVIAEDSLSLIRGILTKHYGLEVVSEESHD